ncbi:Wzz/FepE/Etk N-terminal domain-containing protein [Kineococcus sp. NPDC059986]|uniref:Wzz/FepE/Etk N-terminal domain-containing protein n=1 Tax=Kineococcus sp. NPDC059986 TaxID=3155538 RepID=UPI00344DF3D5
MHDTHDEHRTAPAVTPVRPGAGVQLSHRPWWTARTQPPTVSVRPGGTDLRGLVDVLRRRWTTIAAGCLLGVLAAVGHVALATPTYTSTASLFLSLKGGQTPNELVQGSTYTQQLVQSYVRLTTTPVVLQPVVDGLGLRTSPEQLASSIVVEAPVDSTSLDIRVTRSDPEEAARIAAAVAAQLPQSAAATLTPAANGRNLQVELTTVAPAQVPTQPTSPRPRLELAIGLAAGGLIGLVGAVALEAVRSPLTGRGAVASVTDLPVLVTLPTPAERRRGCRRGRPDPLEEGHRTLREALGLSEPAPVRIVLAACRATSASTTVAVGLARATAESGRRVLLVDADLRSGPRDDIALATGAPADAGLSTALLGSEDWKELVQPWGHRGFDVIAAGPATADPGRLLSSAVMVRILQEASLRYDVVLVRTAEVLSAADAGTLARSTDGVVLLADTRRTSTRDLEEALTRLQSVGADVPGLVLSRSPGRRPTLDPAGSRRHSPARRRAEV